MVIGFKKQFKEPILAGTKIHTLRYDEKDRWKPGKLMHMATGTRTKYYDCFKETPCVSVQRVGMHLEHDEDGHLTKLVVTIVNRALPEDQYEQFAVNDGFATLIDFKKWWFAELAKTPDFMIFLKLLHWTNFRY